MERKATSSVADSQGPGKFGDLLEVFTRAEEVFEVSWTMPEHCASVTVGSFVLNVDPSDELRAVEEPDPDRIQSERPHRMGEMTK